jgi:HlyD family secretion protein
MTKWVTIIAAVAGLCVAIYAIAVSRREAPEVPLAAVPSINPFEEGIAGTGIVEAASRNVLIAAPEGGVVTRIWAEVGQAVKAGDPLFELDTRPLQADLMRARAAREAALADLQRLEAQPRPEEIPVLEAAVEAARATVADLSDQYESLSAAAQRSAASEQEVRRRWFALEEARARLQQAEAQLTLARSGAWAQDIAVARARIAQADADINAIQLLIDRRTVRAPIDGTVLKRDIEPGQFAPADVINAAMVLGDLSSMNIRARIDEEDLPRLREGARGVARLRGSAELVVPLEMIRIEPLARPKTDLSGSTTERVDTRVVEVVFRVTSPSGGDAALPRLYPGQLVDVFIEGLPAEAAAPAPQRSDPLTSGR